MTLEICKCGDPWLEPHIKAMHDYVNGVLVSSLGILSISINSKRMSKLRFGKNV